MKITLKNSKLCSGREWTPVLLWLGLKTLKISPCWQEWFNPVIERVCFHPIRTLCQALEVFIPRCSRTKEKHNIPSWKEFIQACLLFFSFLHCQDNLFCLHLLITPMQPSYFTPNQAMETKLILKTETKFSMKYSSQGLLKVYFTTGWKPCCSESFSTFLQGTMSCFAGCTALYMYFMHITPKANL